MVSPHERKIVIFLGSSTPEKLRDYQHICKEKNLPIYFRDVKELLDAFHSSEEKTGKFRGNGKEKLQHLQTSIAEMMRKEPEILKQKCREYGIEYDGKNPYPDDFYIASDDGGLIVPKDVWENVDKTGISTSLLASIAGDRHNKGGGPGAETGPVMSAIGGAQNLMERVLEAARKRPNPNVPVILTNRAVLTLKSFNPGDVFSSKAIDVAENFYLFEPSDAKRKGFDPTRKRISTMEYYRTKDDTRQSAADLGKKFVSDHSQNASVIDRLATSLGVRNIERITPLKITPPDEFMVGVLPDTGNMASINILTGFLARKNGEANDFKVHYPDHYYHHADGKVAVSGSQTGARRLLGNIEETIKDSDGFVLMPDDHSTKDEKRHHTTSRQGAAEASARELEKFYTLFSLIVAKQLIARDAQKPIIILNHDGSWDKAIASHMHLVNQGMTKDYNISWPPEIPNLPSDAKIESNSYFDVVTAKDYDESLNVALQLLNKKRDKYQRRHGNEYKEVEHGIKPDDADCFKVAVFCSAGSENEKLNVGNMQKLGYTLSKEGFGIVYGAGDRYTMGEVLNGVSDYRDELIADGMSDEEARKKAWIGGFSTPPILISETKRGEFSTRLSYAKQNKNIYDRMADMIDHANAIVVAPGGAGTLQEWVAPLMLRNLEPQLYKDKPIVVFNPTIIDRSSNRWDKSETQTWDIALKHLLGTDYELLTSHPEKGSAKDVARLARSKALGIYVETEKEEVEKRLVTIREESNWKQKVTKTRAHETRTERRPH